MQVVGHEYPAMNLHAFVLLAEPNAVQQYVSIGISGKNIYPTNHSTGAKINGAGITKFVLLTHGVDV